MVNVVEEEGSPRDECGKSPVGSHVSGNQGQEWSGDKYLFQRWNVPSFKTLPRFGVGLHICGFGL